MKYKAIFSDAEDFNETVNSFIAKGWIPFGGIAVRVIEERREGQVSQFETELVQAMIQYEDGDQRPLTSDHVSSLDDFIRQLSGH